MDVLLGRLKQCLDTVEKGGFEGDQLDVIEDLLGELEEVLVDLEGAIAPKSQ